jgi:dCTP deaminase
VKENAMLLSDRDITARLDDGSLGIHPLDRELMQPASVDLTFDRFVRMPYTLPGEELDVAALQADHTLLQEIPEDGLTLEPGEFLLGCTVERVCLPGDLAARVEGKSSLGRLGLAIHVTAGFIDPGFEGQITLEIANLAPWAVRLRPGMRIAQLCLLQMSSPVDKPYGTAGNRYQQQFGPTESRYRM